MISSLDRRLRAIGVSALALYVASIFLANYFILHVGRAPAFPGGPHTVPVWPGIEAPSGVLWIGVALVARDVVQRLLGRPVTVGAILAGAALSYLVAPSLAVASAVAFLLGETVDFLIYTPLMDRSLSAAVVLSGTVGAAVDTLIFLWLAGFLTSELWVGNTLGKFWMQLAALPVLLAGSRALNRRIA